MFAAIDGARLMSLASGRGGIPSAGEWPIVLVLLAVLGFAGTRVLLSLGLTRGESVLVAIVAPPAVLIDVPLLPLTSSVGLAANLAGCVIPAVIATSILASRRVPWAESLFLVGTAIVAAYFSSHVEADQGVLLQYRIPALIVGFLAAGLLFRTTDPTGPSQPNASKSGGRSFSSAGPAAFAAGCIGVIIGADAFRLGDLASGAGAGRVVLGGAGLFDGILLVALLAAAVAELLALVLRTLIRVRTPSEPTL